MLSKRALAAAACVFVFCALVLALRRTHAITDDWMGWRQADTMAIARNLAFVESNPLRPRIDWGGDGPGYVETELQLYPALVAVAFRIFGESVWPAQLLSLLCVALAALVLFDELRRRFGEIAALVSLTCTLFGQGLVIASTSIQPDPLALLAFTVGFFAFVRFLEQPTSRSLLMWVCATALAGLVKPTTLELGIAQVAVLLLAHRKRLLDRRLWLGWATVVVLVAAHLFHARGLYQQYGNTFGVLSGGDSKLPRLARLLEPSRLVALTRYEIEWGIGIPGALAGVLLLARRNVGAEAAGLAMGALTLDLLAFRYTSGKFGTHYHLPHVVLGATLVARAVCVVRVRLASRTIAILAVATSLFTFTRSIRFLRRLPPEPETALGARLAALAAPGTLVAVRARASRFEPEWQTENNYQDPRVFFLSRTRGWAIPRDAAGSTPIADAAAQGARFYVHVGTPLPDAELAAWLAAHGELVARTDGGAIHRLRP